MMLGPAAARRTSQAAIDAVPDAGYTVETLSIDQAANVALPSSRSVLLSDVGTMPSSSGKLVEGLREKGGGVFIALGSDRDRARTRAR